MQITTKQFHELIGVKEAHKAPDALMDILFDREKREQLFREFLEIDKDISVDFFKHYFEEEQAERKSKKQDFTPDSVAKLMYSLSDRKSQDGNYYEVAAGTGSIAIVNWHNDLIENHNPFFYYPHQDFMVLEELSDRAIPFLLFNLLIRGMNAIVVQADSLERTADVVYYIANEDDNWLGFSTLNVMPFNDITEREFDIQFVNYNKDEYQELDTEKMERNIIKHQSGEDEIKLLKKLHQMKDIIKS